MEESIETILESESDYSVSDDDGFIADITKKGDVEPICILNLMNEKQLQDIYRVESSQEIDRVILNWT